MVGMLASNGTDIYHLYCVNPGYTNLINDIVPGMDNATTEMYQQIEDVMCSALKQNQAMMDMLNTEDIFKLVSLQNVARCFIFDFTKCNIVW